MQWVKNKYLIKSFSGYNRLNSFSHIPGLFEISDKQLYVVIN